MQKKMLSVLVLMSLTGSLLPMTITNAKTLPQLPQKEGYAVMPAQLSNRAYEWQPVDAKPKVGSLGIVDVPTTPTSPMVAWEGPIDSVQYAGNGWWDISLTPKKIVTLPKPSTGSVTPSVTKGSPSSGTSSTKGSPSSGTSNPAGSSSSGTSNTAGSPSSGTSSTAGSSSSGAGNTAGSSSSGTGSTTGSTLPYETDLVDGMLNQYGSLTGTMKAKEEALFQAFINVMTTNHFTPVGLSYPVWTGQNTLVPNVNFYAGEEVSSELASQPPYSVDFGIQGGSSQKAQPLVQVNFNANHSISTFMLSSNLAQSYQLSVYLTNAQENALSAIFQNQTW